MNAKRSLTISVCPGRFAIARFTPDAEIPAWATQGTFISVTRTSEELSVVCGEESVPSGFDAARGWRLYKLEGPFAFDEVGVLASVAGPLAEAAIGIFVVSTFDTDYILVKEEKFAEAEQVLKQAGHRILPGLSEFFIIT